MKESHSLVYANGNNGTLLNAASSYENVFIKLVQILKVRTSSSLKQLEELWDSLETSNIDSDPGTSNSSKASNKSSVNNSLSVQLNESSSESNNSDSSNSMVNEIKLKLKSKVNSCPIKVLF